MNVEGVHLPRCPDSRFIFADLSEVDGAASLSIVDDDGSTSKLQYSIPDMRLVLDIGSQLLKGSTGKSCGEQRLTAEMHTTGRWEFLCCEYQAGYEGSCDVTDKQNKTSHAHGQRTN